MSMPHQFLGFLQSNTLQNIQSLLPVKPFDFKELSTLSFSTIKKITIDYKKNEVLGKFVEQFFEYCILHTNRYQLIAKGVQIFDDKITVGELDFIMLDTYSKKTIHVELVYKFYLYDPEVKQEIQRWIGPNRKDSLPQKLEKLTHKQFPLLYHEQTKIALKDYDLRPGEIEQQICYLVNLFIPFSYQKERLQVHYQDCIVGYWIRMEEVSKERFGSLLFYIPFKKEWVMHPKYNKTWLCYDEIVDDIRQKYLQKTSSLLWIKRNEDEYVRLFVVWW
ncbi:DUF1853 family protein [Aquimarina sp. U1-2]|uniref:DUF1853 family protein n=1 Tax=Aquimarina sp. U1-2 TaxID=2823141 RepID=UPI001AECBB81|nr:DUF1853 family protein [Aquimarina sp. U1-2]MBP2832993.1 DUF1853 family protein [Aquimarina sp. U1-2]